MTTSSRQKMCVINPALVPLIAPLVGSQSEIMLRVGISWNSWNKILDGGSIRISMAERFRERVCKIACETESFLVAFPATNGGLDVAAFTKAFLMPAEPALIPAEPAAARPAPSHEMPAEERCAILA